MDIFYYQVYIYTESKKNRNMQTQSYMELKQLCTLITRSPKNTSKLKKTHNTDNALTAPYFIPIPL